MRHSDNIAVKEGSLRKTPSSFANDEGARWQNVLFLQHIHDSFPEREAQQVVRAYTCLVNHYGKTRPEHLRPAEILLEHHADYLVILAALLVPLRRDGYFTSKDILTRFGELPANLVENVYLQSPLRTDTEERRHGDMQALLTSFSDDLNIVILRIGLRLAQLELFPTGLSKEQRKIVQETLELYVPLADQLGMGILRARLEDVSFRLMEPSIYAELERKLKPILAGDALCLDLLKEGIQRLLKWNGVNGTIYGRTKGLYSLYRKMCRQQSSLETIMDRIGLRIIVTSVQECYHVLGLLHTHFRPIPGTFDDYIGFPKASGYQSLHTCIYPVPQMSHKPVEIQIRTDVMHREAEFGVAAHWRYKNKVQANLSNARKLKWFRNLQLQHKKMTTHMEFLEHLRNQVFESDFVVFGVEYSPIKCKL